MQNNAAQNALSHGSQDKSLLTKFRGSFIFVEISNLSLVTRLTKMYILKECLTRIKCFIGMCPTFLFCHLFWSWILNQTEPNTILPCSFVPRRFVTSEDDDLVIETSSLTNTIFIVKNCALLTFGLAWTFFRWINLTKIWYVNVFSYSFFL